MNPANSGSDGVYEGGAFHPSLKKGKSSGRLTLSAEGLGFEAESGSVRMPLGGLDISMGGANDSLVFFKHDACPGWSVHTRDRSILKHPLLDNQEDLRRQLGGIRKKRWLSFGVVAALVFLVLGGLGSLYLFKDAITHFLAGRIPVEWEVQLGEKLFEQVQSKQRVLADSEFNQSLDALTRPLVRGIDDVAFPLKFHIVEDPAINAFAMPGGHVALHTGLILAAETPEEIAGVLAHEIAHVTQRHGFRNIIGSAGVFMIVQMLAGDVGGVVAVIANNSAFLLNRKFSRDFEREADEKGWEYLTQAGIHPRGMVDFFRTLREKELEEAEKSKLNAIGQAVDFLSTHPATEERIERLESKMANYDSRQDSATFQLNLEEFKNRIRASLHSNQVNP